MDAYAFKHVPHRSVAVEQTAHVDAVIDTMIFENEVEPPTAKRQELS
jgi:hypothetical protein